MNRSGRGLREAKGEWKVVLLFTCVALIGFIKI